MAVNAERRASCLSIYSMFAVTAEHRSHRVRTKRKEWTAHGAHDNENWRSLKCQMDWVMNGWRVKMPSVARQIECASGRKERERGGGGWTERDGNITSNAQRNTQPIPNGRLNGHFYTFLCQWVTLETLCGMTRTQLIRRRRRYVRSSGGK